VSYPFHRKIISAAVANNYSFALCKLPRNRIIRTYIANEKPEETVVKTRINRCFLFSEFDNGHNALMLKPAVYFEDEKLIGDEDKMVYSLLLNPIKANSNNQLYYPSKKANSYSSEVKYSNLVNQSVEAIETGEFKKIVAARCFENKLDNHFDAVKYFHTLCETYNNAFIYFFSSPEIGTWIGATPEKLVTVDIDTLQTVALAGTLEKNSPTDWTKKEREEQAHVENFISTIFANNGISDFDKGKVQTIAAGNLRHLQTSFSWQADPEIIQNIFAAFLKELNPTPAVCGLPKLESAAFIKKNEGFERRFYSGFAGIADHHSTHLFVNLRCMELMKEEAILYAGAGIVAQSDAKNEWLETEKKMQTLGSLL